MRQFSFEWWCIGLLGGSIGAAIVIGAVYVLEHLEWVP